MKAHRTDLVSFAFGLVFLALSAWWLLAQILGFALPAVGWFLASALILIGVFGLVGALRSGQSGPPKQTAEVGATEVAAPVSGVSAPVPGMPTSGAALPVWEAERSTWDAPASPATPETATTEVRAPQAPSTEVIHPAWLAHQPAEPETAPITGQPDDPTLPLVNRAPEGDEPARSDHPDEPAGDQPGDGREGRRGEV